MDTDPIGELTLVMTTVSDRDTAESLARSLVEERLIACANLLPGLLSVYRWNGEVRAEGEVLLLMKTRRERLPRLKERLSALHPYEVPELLAVPIVDGLEAYCHWVIEETAAEQP